MPNKVISRKLVQFDYFVKANKITEKINKELSTSEEEKLLGEEKAAGIYDSVVHVGEIKTWDVT